MLGFSSMPRAQLLPGSIFLSRTFSVLYSYYQVSMRSHMGNVYTVYQATKNNACPKGELGKNILVDGSSSCCYMYLILSKGLLILVLILVLGNESGCPHTLSTCLQTPAAFGANPSAPTPPPRSVTDSLMQVVKWCLQPDGS